VSVEEAATIGVGSLTASLGLIVGTQIAFPNTPQESTDSAEWIVVLGGAASVGQYTVQIAKLCGYKVLASCSPSNNELVKGFGADATFNYKTTLEEQISQIESVTKRNFARVYDASGQAAETALEALKTASDAKVKYFATTNDWSPLQSEDDTTIYPLPLGLIGRSGDARTEKVNQDIQEHIPRLEEFFGSGALKPMTYDVVGTGFEGVLKGIEVLNAGKGNGKKVIVKLQDA